ncbi:phosphotransferase enzyme family protein [Shimazuella alba]|uniref:Phosphotransferase n=1 Tax=Shimazuella alba TaxID=2690964 RepID=A0A6I4VZK5_9BACL|nr:phosphotransferase [Shimazuella alba]MXQ55988.1 phosphotransferase [Shimazuella alba]
MWKQDIVDEAVRRFHGTESSSICIGGFYQNVFQYERDGEEFILKLIPSANKDRNMLHSEMKWIQFLRKNGIQIPKNVLSKRGNTIEVIHSLPIPCCAISYEKAEGEKINNKETAFFHWNDYLFTRWGQEMGKMHAISKKFHLQEVDTPFDDWDQGEIYHRDLSTAPKLVQDRWIELRQKASTFTRNQKTYGLIHNEFSNRNFLLTKNRELIIFDLNHVKYHWYTYDIAIALYNALHYVSEYEQSSFKQEFLHKFMFGYFCENELEDDWEEKINFFLKFYTNFRYLYLHIYLHKESASKEKLEEFKRLEAIVNPSNKILRRS